MESENGSKNSVSGLNAKVTDLFQRLSKLTDDAARSEAMLRHLQTVSKFHHYSWGNQLLIMISNPNATQVAGYKTWLKLNRYVRRGEHGIPILAPCVHKTKDAKTGDESSTVSGFRVAYVFDVAQTDGEPLQMLEWADHNRSEELHEALIRFADKKGIEVEIREISGGAMGLSMSGKIALDPEAGTSTFVHEIAHELLGHGKGDQVGTINRELEAEAVAYIVTAHFGIPDEAACNYLALWTGDSEKLAARFEHIQRTAIEIIRAVTPNGKEPIE